MRHLMAHDARLCYNIMNNVLLQLYRKETFQLPLSELPATNGESNISIGLLPSIFTYRRYTHYVSERRHMFRALFAAGH